MNFIAATVDLTAQLPGTVEAYGLNYRSASAIVPAGNNNSQVRLRLLCYQREGAKLKAFTDWLPGARALITGNIVFSDDSNQELDVIVSTIEPNIPAEMYCNQVILGNAFFGSNEIKERKNGQIATKIGSTLDNSDTTTWLFLEAHESRKPKLQDRIRKGRAICVQGYLREYRKDDSDSPYRAIVASDFTTRKDLARNGRNTAPNSTAAGYSEIDPTPDY